MKNAQQLLHKLHLPGLISLGALFFAWSAILLFISDEYALSTVMAVAAFLLDSLDGFTARALKRESEFGRQLDGMIDAFAYSFLAALIVWHAVLPGTLGVIVGYIVLATGILRLIGFNQAGYIKKNGVLYYQGVVTCHLLLLVFIFLIVQQFIELPVWLIATTITLFAVLQLSSIKTRKTKALLFWIPVAIAAGIAGVIWL